jgi:hypothetical protein
MKVLKGKQPVAEPSFHIRGVLIGIISDHMSYYKQLHEINA